MDPIETQEEENIVPEEPSFSKRQNKLAATYLLAVYWDRGRGCHLVISNVRNGNEDILQVGSNDSTAS